MASFQLVSKRDVPPLAAIDQPPIRDRSEQPYNVMWETVGLRELRVFLSRAEELLFGGSAERLGLSRSAAVAAYTASVSA